ncbi:MAG: hypothetical protein KTR30_33100 [Saprospiraceae bacterium]|nr:hypothetical protein [Saprospiraceae bacterium]
MGDNYFDEKLKDILESPPEYEPDTLALQDMQKRLRGRGGGASGIAWIPWVLSSVLLLLLAGGGILFQRLFTLQSKIDRLENQLTTTQTTTDTIIHQQIIQHYDTIYTIVYQEKYLPVEAALANFPNLYRPNSPTLFSQGGTRRTLSGQPVLDQGIYSWSLDENRYSLLERSPSSSFFTTDQFTAEVEMEEDFWGHPAMPISELKLKQLRTKPSWAKASVDGPGLPITPYKKSTISPLYYFTPIGLDAEVAVSPVVLPSHELGGSSYALGAGFGIQLPGNRSLLVGAEWLSMDFDLKAPEQFDRFPILDPEDPTDVLHELKGYFSYLQVPVSLRQVLFTKNNWGAALSIGMVAVKPVRHRLEYEYLNGQGEYKLANNVPTAPFSIRNLRLGLSSQFQLNRKFSLNPALQYQHAFEVQEREFFPLTYWSLRLGLKYNFSE